MTLNKSEIKWHLVFFLTIISFAVNVAHAAIEEDKYQQVEVAEPFVELHTGPGRGYPVFFIIERGNTVKLIKRKTQWYKVKSQKGTLGWVHEDKLARTLTTNGQTFEIDKPDQQQFVQRDFETGVLAGSFEGATVMTLTGGWNWTPNITAELAFSQAIGNVSDIQFVNLNLMHQPFPEWRYSPYVKIGTGAIFTQPNATLVQAEDRNDEMVNAGIGLRIYISRQFFIRAEYNSYTILTSRNDNDEVEEWKIGFSVFY